MKFLSDRRPIKVKYKLLSVSIIWHQGDYMAGLYFQQKYINKREPIQELGS